jgi:hypothetical protein
MHLEKKIILIKQIGSMDVDQNTFGGPIIIIALVHGKPVGATASVQYVFPKSSVILF